jgi:hypothetical protein
MKNWRGICDSRLDRTIAELTYGVEIGYAVTAALGNRAGTFRSSGIDRGHRIVLHPMQSDTEAFETFVHEYAHFVDHMFGNARGHGVRWAAIMLMLGQRPTRCHTMNLKGRARACARDFERGQA